MRQALQLLDRASGWAPKEDVWERDGRFYDPFRPNVFAGGFKSEDDLIRVRTSHLAAVNRVFTESVVVVFEVARFEPCSSHFADSKPCALECNVYAPKCVVINYLQ